MLGYSLIVAGSNRTYVNDVKTLTEPNFRPDHAQVSSASCSTGRDREWPRLMMTGPRAIAAAQRLPRRLASLGLDLAVLGDSRPSCGAGRATSWSKRIRRLRAHHPGDGSAGCCGVRRDEIERRVGVSRNAAVDHLDPAAHRVSRRAMSSAGPTTVMPLEVAGVYGAGLAILHSKRRPARHALDHLVSLALPRLRHPSAGQRPF